MNRLVWLTDLHLNFLPPRDVTLFFERVAAEQPDAVLLGGDIGEAPTFEDYLIEMAEIVGRPVYFVLGNHDYYGGSIDDVRARAVMLAEESEHLRYLPTCGVVELNATTALIGHGGWGDARLGDFSKSRVMLNDYTHIRPLMDLTKPHLRQMLEHLGDQAADYIGETLKKALEHYDRAIVLTHVPPFKEATWHEGEVSNDDWLPHFSCKAVGDVLRELAEANPEKKLNILCGHTHGAGEAEIAPNLHVTTGGAQYYKPEIQATFELD